MTAAEVLALAKAQGVTIKLDGAALEIIADRKPDPDLLEAIAGCKPKIVAALAGVEPTTVMRDQLHAELSAHDQARIDKWIRDRLIDWPSTPCLHCRRPIIVGQLWAIVSNGEVAARFHQPCHGEWLEVQEAAARRALGLAP